MTMPRLDITGHALANARRARMLCAMVDGRARTKKELACDAGITPQTASVHLHLLAQAGLIAQRPSGRCLYHRLAGPEVALMLEHVAGLTPCDTFADRQRAKAAGLVFATLHWCTLGYAQGLRGGYAGRSRRWTVTSSPVLARGRNRSRGIGACGGCCVLM